MKPAFIISPAGRLPDTTGDWRAQLCHGRAVKQTSQAGGALMALAIIAGALAGAAVGEPSLGVLAGIAVAVATAVLVWLADRRRGGR